MTGATGALVSLGARGRHRFFLVLAMGKWNQLHTRHAALKHKGLKLKERKATLCNQAEKLAKSFLDAGDVSRESMLAELGKWSFAPKTF